MPVNISGRPNTLSDLKPKRLVSTPSGKARAQSTQQAKNEAPVQRAEGESYAPAPRQDTAQAHALLPSQRPNVSPPTPPPAPARSLFAGAPMPADVGPYAIKEHRFVATTSTRAMEQPLAEVAATHPQAVKAAHTALLRAKRFMEMATPNGFPAAKIFGSFTNEKERTGHRYNQTGDIDPSRVDEAIEHGNIREHMCMLGNSQPIIAKAMYEVGARAENDPAYAAAFGRETGADMAAIVARYKATKEAGRPPEQFLHALEGTESVNQPHMRKKGAGPRRARRFSDHPFTPPLSEREIEHLDAWRAEQHATGVAVPTRQSSLGKESFLLPQEDGKTIFRPKASHPWHKHSNDNRMSTGVSISGTSYRLMHLNALLGAKPEEGEHFRTALLGHVTPYHHTYHEVMSASVEMGMQYTPGVHGMRTHAQKLLESRPSAHDTGTSRALLQKLSSVRRYEAEDE